MEGLGFWGLSSRRQRRWRKSGSRMESERRERALGKRLRRLGAVSASMVEGREAQCWERNELHHDRKMVLGM